MHSKIIHHCLSHLIWLLDTLTTSSGPALGIGGGCDSLGPMPLGGPKKFLWWGVYIEIFGFLEIYIAMFTKRPEN